MSPQRECSIIDNHHHHRTEVSITSTSSSSMSTSSGSDSYSQAMILHPKCNKPAVLRKLERKMKIGKMLAKQRQTTNVIISREAIPLPATAAHDLELETQSGGLMTMQVLSARASTPYTQPNSLLSCTAGSCDLLHLSPPPVIKKPLETAGQAQMAKRSISSTTIAATTSGGLRLPKLRNTQSLIPLMVSSSSSGGAKLSLPLQCYTRQHLLDIRNSMLQSMLHHSKESLSFSMPRIATCDDIELEARLRRMNLWRSAANNLSAGHNNFKQRTNSGNECMPAFYNKNKSKQQLQQITDESIIQSQPPQQPQEYQVCNVQDHQMYIYIYIHIYTLSYISFLY